MNFDIRDIRNEDGRSYAVEASVYDDGVHIGDVRATKLSVVNDRPDGLVWSWNGGAAATAWVGRRASTGGSCATMFRAARLMVKSYRKAGHGRKERP